MKIDAGRYDIVKIRRTMFDDLPRSEGNKLAFVERDNRLISDVLSGLDLLSISWEARLPQARIKSICKKRFEFAIQQASRAAKNLVK